MTRYIIIFLGCLWLCLASSLIVDRGSLGGAYRIDHQEALESFHDRMLSAFYYAGYGIEYRGHLARGWKSRGGWQSATPSSGVGVWKVGKIRLANKIEREVLGLSTVDPLGEISIARDKEDADRIVYEQGVAIPIRININDSHERQAILVLFDKIQEASERGASPDSRIE